MSRHLLVLLVAVIAACANPESSPTPVEPTPPPNVIFALVDTLRADHTSLHGYHRRTTPFLEALAAQSAVFERGRSQAGCTYPSVNSFMTSRYAFDFYRRGPDDMGIPKEFPTIAELLKRRGYSTAAVSASPIVRRTPSDHNPSAGFDAGFDMFDESCLWASAECVNQRALEILGTLQEPFFLYLHYMDPHAYYQPPAGFRSFAKEYDGLQFIAAGDPNPIGEMIYDNGPEIDFDDGDIQHLIDLYDDEILYFDTVFARLVDHLVERGILDRSLLVVTSDHGEEFLEHGHVQHCRGVWNTLTHVPLLVRPPLGAEAMRIGDPVQLIDLLPTILDYSSVPFTSASMEGVSLRPLIDGSGGSRPYAFADQSKYRGVDDGRFHLILDGVENTYELYDTHTDPLEQENLASRDESQTERLAGELNDWLRATGQWVRFDHALAAGKAQEEQLRALGYLE